MASQDFYRLNNQLKLEVFEEIAKEQDLPLYSIEKDWWVVQTLSVIFQMDFADQLLFKGGTSLSKAWKIINRLSEDIDLALNREYLGFSSGKISKSQVKNLRKKSFQFVTNTFYETLRNSFKSKGYDVTFSLENFVGNDQDPVSILIKYPNVTPYSQYVLPRVKVELGSRSLKDPFTNCIIQSFVGQQFYNLPFVDTPIRIPCVNPERTFLEKLFLMHEEFKKPQEKIRVNRLSRHLYDLVRIYNSENHVKIFNDDLITTIIQHRESITPIRGIDYNTLFPPFLIPIPPKHLFKALETDYKTMQAEMIHGESPSFSDLIETITIIAYQYNKLKIRR